LATGLEIKTNLVPVNRHQVSQERIVDSDKALDEIKDIYYLEDIEQLEAIADPIRYRMYFRMTEPKTGAQLARALGISRARAHYHLNILKEAGLVVFYGESLSHGITEKYYHGIARFLDFSRLIPKDQQTLVPNEVTLRSFKAAVGFIANLLDWSREGIAHLKVHEGLGIGFHYILNTELTPGQFRLVREELAALKDRIIEMEQKNEHADETLPSVNCRITLFLTPVSDELLEIEPESEE
jgi:DNA-binding transcriptional ArsR family regulator